MCGYLFSKDSKMFRLVGILKLVKYFFASILVGFFYDIHVLTSNPSICSFKKYLYNVYYIQRANIDNIQTQVEIE